MWQTPSALDLTRPLRSDPVRRQEVFVHPRRWRLLTMPLGTYTREEHADRASPVLVGDLALWAAVLNEMAAEHAAATAVRRQAYEQALSNGWRPAPWMTQSLPFEAQPLFDAPWVREYVCEVCGVGFLGVTYYRYWHSRYRVCSKVRRKNF